MLFNFGSINLIITKISECYVTITLKRKNETELTLDVKIDRILIGRKALNNNIFLDLIEYNSTKVVAILDV